MLESFSHAAAAAIEAQNGSCEWGSRTRFTRCQTRVIEANSTIVHRSRRPEIGGSPRGPTGKIIAGRIERLRSLNRLDRDGRLTVVRDGAAAELAR